MTPEQKANLKKGDAVVAPNGTLMFVDAFKGEHIVCVTHVPMYKPDDWQIWETKE